MYQYRTYFASSTHENHLLLRTTDKVDKVLLVYSSPVNESNQSSCANLCVYVLFVFTSILIFWTSIPISIYLPLLQNLLGATNLKDRVLQASIITLYSGKQSV